MALVVVAMVCPRSKDRHIPLSFKHFIIRLTIGILRGVKVIKNGLGLFFAFGLGRPLSWIGRGSFRVLVLPLYTQYIKTRQRLKSHPLLVEVQSIGHFVERYAVYAILVLLGVLAVGNNLFARTIRPDELGRGSIWTSFVFSETSDLIVETAISQPVPINHALAYVVGSTTGTADIAADAPTIISNELSTAPLAVGGPAAATGVDSDQAQRQETITYTVESGDTLSTIAHRFGLTSPTLVWANGMTDSDFIKPGQVLKIPPVEGYLYRVKKGDTVASIIKKYGGTENSILDVNHLAAAEAIQPGQDIIIPGGEPPAPVQAPFSSRRPLGQIYGGPSNGTPPPSAPGGRTRFIWPTTNHKINQYFRGRYHTGVDIEGTYSSPIYAAAAGRVIFAAYDRSGYGLHVVINHGNGYETLYGHASKIFVSVGQQVKQGQTIAMVGSTGRSTGTHLHFEIRIGGGFLNPLSFF